MDNLYMNKKNRDGAYKAIPKVDRGKYKRYSIRGQLLHPMYVEDWERETGRTLTKADKGFGNTIYRTHFPTLYGLRLKEDWE